MMLKDDASLTCFMVRGALFGGIHGGSSSSLEASVRAKTAGPYLVVEHQRLVRQLLDARGVAAWVELQVGLEEDEGEAVQV